jgi:hypothetical protein
VTTKTLRLETKDLEGERVRAQLAGNVANMAIPAHAILVKDVVFAASGTKDVPHGLGRPASGYFPVNLRTGGVTIYRTVRTTDEEKTQLRLTSSGACTLDVVIW